MQIKKFDHYPDKICDKCLKNLHIAYKFRRICQRSYKHLRQFIAPVVVEQEQLTDENVAVMDVNNEVASTEMDETHALAGNEEIEEEMDAKERLVHVKSEQVEEDGTIEELYDVYEAYEGEIIPEQQQAHYEDGAGEEVEGDDGDAGAHSISGLSADIEYLEQLDQDQLTESAHEDEIEVQHSSDEEFLPIKSRSIATRSTSGAGVKRRANQRKTTTTSKSAVSKIKRESCNVTTTNIILNPDESITFGETIVRKTTGIKTKGGHKILVGDKKEFKYICDICGNMYPSQSRLTEHIKVHSGVKPHECE